MMNFQAACAEPRADRNASDIQRRRQQRCLDFATQTAAVIRSAADCRFSLLDSKTLTQGIANWYEGCSHAMLDGNYSWLDQWVGEQASLAEQREFGPKDLLQLLRTCRNMAIEVEHWNEDVFSPVDDVINEGLRRILVDSDWFPGAAPPNFDYRRISALDDSAAPPSDLAELEGGDATAERRGFRRVRLWLPVRVRGTEPSRPLDEITHTRDVSRTGLTLSAGPNYRAKSILKVNYPYWTDPGAINPEYAAEVLRLDRHTDGTRSVAIRFVKPLRGIRGK